MSGAVPVAVTGVGCICAAGKNYKECMKSIFGSIRGPSPPRAFASQHPIQYPVFEINDFSEEKYHIDPDIFRTSQLGLTSAMEALNDAGWDCDTLRSKRVGICVGTTVGSAMNNEPFYREYRKGHHPEMDPIKRYLKSNPAQSIAREIDATGPVQTIVNACSSGSDAIGIGASWIRSGICDLVIAGGADELCRTTYNGFISLMIYDDSPCKPFDRERKGLNLGEGAAMLVLESRDTIRSSGKRIRSYVHGYGIACDAYHITAPSPDGKGLKKAVKAAMSESGITPGHISFINAHGTGTQENDKAESHVLRELFPGIPFFSTKGYTGHTLGAAGAIEAVFTSGFLEVGRIPGSMGFISHDPNLPADPVSDSMDIVGRFAISQSLAFGGQNAVLIFGNGTDRP